jgi:predicted ArsR family transcriptional regulator
MAIWTRRFFETTKGRLVALLRRSTLTVDEMAQTLGVTDNAIRAQLVSLERDGLVEQRGLRRGGGKPSQAYGLSPDFEPLLSRAYAPLLIQLLRELAARLQPPELDELLRAVGQRWARELPHPGGTPRERAAAASRLLDGLGGLTELQEVDGKLVIRGHGCPLGLAVREDPRVCAALETLLSSLVGGPILERCDRGENGPHCRFQIPLS